MNHSRIIAVLLNFILLGAISCKSDAHPETPKETGITCVRPKAKAPLFKVFRQPKDSSDIVPLVVPSSTTNEQVVSLLWLVKDHVDMKNVAELGIKAPSSFLLSGMVEVFKGSRCATEDDFDAPLPCGSGNHSTAFYQWGIKDNPQMDFAGLTLKDGSFTKLFGSADFDPSLIKK